MNNCIKIIDVSFKYNEYEDYVLKNINLTINEGEFVCIVGGNGSGKSTLSKLINGIYELKYGDIFVNSMSVRDQKNILDIRKILSIVFQNPDNQIVSTLVLDDVVFGLENILNDREEIQKRVYDALEKVHMLDYKDHNTNMLSGGQKQRVSIAGVLSMKPKYIIFDESTSMLDPNGKREVLSILKEINEVYGITVILITHFIEECLLANRIVVLSKGIIKYDGNPRKILWDEKFLFENNLDTTPSCRISNYLKKMGFHNEENIFDLEELVDLLCQLNLKM